MSDPNSVALNLSRAEALVLFEFLARTSQDESRVATCHAERIVLWNVEALLEAVLTEPLGRDYEAVVAAARQEIEGGDDSV